MIVTINPQAVSVSVGSDSLDIGFGNPVTRDYVERDPYTGEYTVTPTAEAQTLETKHLRMTDDITITAIPQNYGLITWNGAFLTVS